MQGTPLFRATAVLCGIIIIAAVAYIQLRTRLHLVETAQQAVFTPAESVLAERARFRVNQDLGDGAISTTLPVSVGAQPIAFAQSFSAPKPDSKGKFNDETDADEGAAPVMVKGAYLLKFNNTQLCNGEVCPIVLAPKAEGGDVLQAALFKIDAKNVWVSTRKTNGNPDLIVDYGNGGLPTRMVWDTGGQFPSYIPATTDAAHPLPELK